MATTTPTSPTDMTGQVMAEAARRMAPVLVSKLLTAVADQGVAKIEQLAERLDESRERSAAGPQEVEAGGADASEGSGLGGIGAFLMAQARALLDLVVRLVAQAAEMLRRATERLRSRRAPEGIEAEAEEIDVEDAELEDAELEDAELEDAELEDAELEDAELEDEGARVPA